MIPTTEFYNQLEEKTSSIPDNYFSGDGLLYCGKCHTPLQFRMKLNGQQKILPCLCQCRKEEDRRFRQQEEKKKQRVLIQKLRTEGLQEKQLLDWRFETAEETAAIQWARRYVENWEQVKADNLGLLLWGEVGTGKSFTAACIANALLEQSIPVMMTNFSKILNQMGTMYSEQRYRYIASFSDYTLLIIDDLGIERSTEYAREQVYAMIDERYKAHLALIVTTNLTIHELRCPSNISEARIYSRLLEMCTPIHIGGEDRRKAKGKAKQEQVKQFLFPGGGGE